MTEYGTCFVDFTQKFLILETDSQFQMFLDLTSNPFFYKVVDFDSKKLILS